MPTDMFQKFLDERHTTLSACLTLDDKFRGMLWREINIRSRLSLRPLTISDMPNGVLTRIFEHMKE